MNTTKKDTPDTNNSLTLGLIKISGQDAFSFLQGQLSNDINELDNTREKRWQYSGYCNPKGRLIALLQIWSEGGDLFALMSKDLIETTVKRLQMYVMRSKVSIEVLESAQCFGFSSLGAVQAIDEKLTDKLSKAPNAVASTEQLSVLAVGNRYLLIDKTANIKNAVSDPNWLASQIDDGLPNVSQGSSELFIPQMLNLDLLGGINFKKGCYTGQEIIARMHYLGKLKQRMFVCQLIESNLTGIENKQETPVLNPGDSIYSDVGLSKSAGTVVSATLGSDKVLAVLRLADLEQAHYISDAIGIKPIAQQPYDVSIITKQN